MAGGGELQRGLYELLVTSGLAERLSGVDGDLVSTRRIHRAEVASRVALHLGLQIERALRAESDTSRVDTAAAIVSKTLELLQREIAAADLADEALDDPPRLLHSVTTRRPDGEPRAISEPTIPLLDTTLLTNAPGEPRVGHQLREEVDSADAIDVVMAFIRTSGIAPLTDVLRRHCDDGKPLRVLTTTYTGSTQAEALDRLVALGADVRVSYDTSTTRLHAKAWLFHRRSGYSTAYIGSSNLTHSAQVSGLEWNVRVSSARNADVIDKVRAVFDTYWEGGDFRPYERDDFERETARHVGTGPTVYLSPVAVTPQPFQQRMLDQLQVERLRGRHRNLIVSATGTGKTVMAALDYRRLRAELPRARLLSVAHRQEILDQSQATFRHVLHDASFGEQWVGGRRPEVFDHVFASVQTLANLDLAHLAPDHFDVVIVDEFHHAAATSYDRLLAHLQPHELVGLTATPERADGLPVLHWFDDRIAAELRLWDAIDQHYLAPFAYYGIHDGTRLEDIPWRRGTGYDVEQLTNLYTANDVWARRVVHEFQTRLDDPTTARALGFCVSKDHALFMARVFTDHGIAAAAITSDTPDAERHRSLGALERGELRVVFSVDIFNEGVDVPSVDTLVMLRPTESPTLFLQQLGRGLRRHPGKAMCTVLDFVGHHRKEFRFDRKLRALLGGTRKDVEQQVEQRFPYLPAGCHMELDAVASDIVLRSIRNAIPSKWPEKVAELRSYVAAGHEVSLAGYLDHTGLDLDDVYAGKHCWSDLLAAAGVPVAAAGPEETVLRTAIGRLLHVDDSVRIDGWRSMLALPSLSVDELPLAEQRLVRMLTAQVLSESSLPKGASLQEGVDLLWQHPQVRAELRELLGVLAERDAHVHTPLAGRPDVPLQVHARYTRLEILSAFGHGDGQAKAISWQSGTFWMPEIKADFSAFTLDKTGGTFSPTTRYRDYAISPTLLHWESQSITRADSETGQRYQRHEAMGIDKYFFARLHPNDRSFWFLGTARYVKHEGERPMGITWRLSNPLPGDLFTQFAAAVA